MGSIACNGLPVRCHAIGSSRSSPPHKYCASSVLTWSSDSDPASRQSLLPHPMALRCIFMRRFRGSLFASTSNIHTRYTNISLNLPNPYRPHTTKAPGIRRDHAQSATATLSPAAEAVPTPASVQPAAVPLISQKAAAPAPNPVVVDGMPRWPSLTSSGGLLRALDWVGTISFAHSGAVLAASLGMDVLGTAAVGTITAVGGGTIRDAVFLSRPPFWTSETEYLALCVATAVATFSLWPSVEDQIPGDHPVLFAGDTLGVAAFCVIGAQNGIRAGMPLPVSVLCGMATATFGGAVRDVLCKRDVRIFHSHAEIYATTAACGASAYLLARSAGAPLAVKVAAGLGTAGALRYTAWKEGIRLPVWSEETA